MPDTDKGYEKMKINLFMFLSLAGLLVLSCSEEKKSICPDENHPHMIDLGLPSRTKWACCNVGATSPEATGGYYSWGETNIKSSYDCDNYNYPGHIGNIAATEYDVANSQWGSEWQMPTAEQIYELLYSSKKEWTTYRGVKGYKITGPNDESIFLPAVGYVYEKGSSLAGEAGFIWSSEREDLDDTEGMIRYSKCLVFNKSGIDCSEDPIEFALNVRAISK